MKGFWAASVGAEMEKPWRIEDVAIPRQVAGKQSHAGSKASTRKAKVDAQALELIRERMRLLGESWRDGCAIKIPKGFDEKAMRGQ